MNTLFSRSRSPFQLLMLFLFLNAMIWTLIPVLTHSCLPLDTVESETWGQCFSLGNYKHPPLSGWISGLACAITGHADWVHYLLSQIMVMLGLYFVYRIAREFWDEKRAVISTMLLSFIFYYNFTTPEFNVNVMELALWPITAFFYLRTIRTRHIGDWMMLGICAGLCMLTKYFGGLFLLTLGLHMVIYAHARRCLRSLGPYLAVAISLLVFAPHLMWLLEHDFLPINYALSRASGLAAKPWYNTHLQQPIRLILSQLPLLILPSLVAWGMAGFPRRRKDFVCIEKNEGTQFAWFLFCVPLSIMLIVCVAGVTIRTMWCVPMFFLFGILGMQWIPYHNVEKYFSKFYTVSMVVMILIAGIYATFALCAVGSRKNFDQQSFITMCQACYAEKAGLPSNTPIPFVVGDQWSATLLHHYLPNHPPVCILADPYDRERFKERFEGAFFIYDNPEIADLFINVLKLNIELDSCVMPLPPRSILSACPIFYYGVIAPTLDSTK